MPETKRDQLDGLSQAMLAQYNRREDVSLPHCHDIMGRGTIEGSIIRRLEHAVADLDYQGRLEEPALPVPEVADGGAK